MTTGNEAGDTVTWLIDAEHSTIECELHADTSLTLRHGSAVMVPPGEGTYKDERVNFVQEGADEISLSPEATDTLYSTLSELLPYATQARQ